jgi:hypothetical protein
MSFLEPEYLTVYNRRLPIDSLLDYGFKGSAAEVSFITSALSGTILNTKMPLTNRIEPNEIVKNCNLTEDIEGKRKPTN